MSQKETQEVFPETSEKIHGVVFLTKPSPADVIVQDMAGETVYKTQASSTGNFFFPKPTPMGRLKIIATCEEGTRLEVVTDGQKYPWIDVLSHLASLYLAEHPDLSIADADRAIRSGLGLDPDCGTNGLSSLAGSPFSARLFLEKADEYGDFDEFCATVVSRIGEGAKVTFRPPVRALMGTGNPRSFAAEEEGGGVLTLLSSLGQDIGGNLLTSGVTDLIGMGLGALGLNVGDSKTLAQIQSTLAEVQSELEALISLVENMQLSDQLLADYNAIQQINRIFQTQSDSLAEQTLAASEHWTGSSATQFDHGPAAIPSALTTIMENLLDADVDVGVKNLIGYLNSEVVADNFVLSFNSFFASQNYPDPEDNYEQHFFYSLRQDGWTAGDTINLQAALDFVRSSVMTGINLLSESAQLSVLPAGQLSGVNPPSTALNLVRSGGGNDGVLRYIMELLTAQNMVPEPVGNAEVLIDLTHNRMWYLQYMPGGIGSQWADAQGHLTGSPPFQLGPWTAAPYPSKYQNDYFNSELGPSGGWRLPTWKECDDLRVVADAMSQFSLEALGFNVPSNANNRIHLYGKPYAGSLGTTEYAAYDWTGGGSKLYTELAYGGGPQWNYLFVRNIPDFTSGDSADLCMRSYGFLPQVMNIFLNGDRLENGSTVAGAQNGKLKAWGQSPNQPHDAYDANLTDRIEWTTSDASVMDFAYTGNDQVICQWHTPGSVTVKATFRGADPSSPTSTNAPTPYTASVIMTSPLAGADTFSSIAVSPYNTGYLAPPDENDQQTFYLLGFFSGGGVSDLTSQATWEALDPDTQKPLDASICAFSDPAAPGSLVFGADAASVQAILVQATYDKKTYEASVAY